MKLQYLGDSSDAFKWDLLHRICTTSPFSKLVYVPFLTPDIEDSTEGQTPHHRFKCQNSIRPFLEKLKEGPRSLRRISTLGTINPQKRFQVSVFAPDRFIGTGALRREYWSDFDPSRFANSVVFFDPDNGFETKTKHGNKWIRHDELKSLFARLPNTSVALVYQHRPFFRRWDNMFADLTQNLAYVDTVVAAHVSELAFVALAGNVTAGQKITVAIKQYAAKHPTVRVISLLPKVEKKRFGPESACDLDGEEDAAMQELILDNPEAHRAFP